MHIPDNYLSPASCAVLAVAAAPVVGLSITKVKAQLKENKELATNAWDCGFSFFLINDV